MRAAMSAESVIAGVLSLIWGLVLALLRQVPGKAAAPIRGLAIAYIDVFRGIPMLLVVLMISGSAPFVAEGLGLPRSVGIPQWFGKSDPFWYGTMALTITYGAYMAEVYRAGIEGVPRGQMEAARALGMSHGRAMRHVIVPQAVRLDPELVDELFATGARDDRVVGRDGVQAVEEPGQQHDPPHQMAAARHDDAPDHRERDREGGGPRREQAPPRGE